MKTDSGCLTHRRENEAECESTFLQARPELMAARSPLPSASLEKSEGTPRKGKAPTGMYMATRLFFFVASGYFYGTVIWRKWLYDSYGSVTGFGFRWGCRGLGYTVKSRAVLQSFAEEIRADLKCACVNVLHSECS